MSKAEFDDLDEAVEEMRRRALELRATAAPLTGRLAQAFGPERQVRARLQLSGRGLLRKPVAGVDLRGDGNFVPFRGGVGREELDPSEQRTPFDVVRRALATEEAERR